MLKIYAYIPTPQRQVSTATPFPAPKSIYSPPSASCCCLNSCNFELSIGFLHGRGGVQSMYNQFCHVSTRLRVRLRPLPLPRSSRISCSVTSGQLEAPVAAKTGEAKKPDCYGVFCLTYDLKAEEETKSWNKLINVAVSGAARMIANHLLFKIASGEVFRPGQPIALKLLGSERSIQALEGVAMELEDTLFPLPREVSIGIDPYEVFQDADWALLIGAKPPWPWNGTGRLIRY